MALRLLPSSSLKPDLCVISLLFLLLAGYDQSLQHPPGLAHSPACHCVPLTPHRHRRLVCFTVVLLHGDYSYLFNWNIEAFSKKKN